MTTFLAPNAASLSRPSSASAVACTHCGLTVPAGLVERDAEQQFCCNGCRAAFELVSACRLEDAYSQSGQRASGRTYAEFDDPAFTSLYVHRRADELAQVQLLIEGVHCAACVWLLEKLPSLVPGVIESTLNFRHQRLGIVFDPARCSVSAIARAIDSFGYRPHPARDETERRLRRSEDHRHLVRIGVAAACAGNVMVLAFALYGGVFGGIQPQYEQLFRWLSMVIGVVCLAWPGAVFFRSAWVAIRTRTPNLDLPICVALGAGGVMGTINTVLGRGEIYFDSVTAIVFLLLIGRFIQHRQQRWASDAVELLFSLIPSRATKIEDDRPRVVPVEVLAPGDLVEVGPGESVPVDGLVESGASAIDESLLTGESRPVEVAVGSRVAAGSSNLSGVLRVRVLATGRDTRAGRIMALVEESSRRRPPIARFTDRVARWFVVGVSILATITLGLWLVLDPAHAIDHAAAMLIVTCPCMLGLAAPLVMATTIGRGARRGILIKGGDVLERLSTPGVLMLDKTGTITEGRLSLVRWEGDRSVIPLAAALESKVSHPIARALAAAGEWSTAPVVEEIEQTTGAGVRGVVDGRALIIGTLDHLRLARVDGLERAESWQRAISAEGLTPVLVAIEGRCVAAAALGDKPRPDARTSLDSLAAEGWDVGVLSGDHASTVQVIAQGLGLDPSRALGGVSPEGKAAAIIDLASTHRDRRPVVMVGDGVNDSAALAAASVGIAVHGGAEASLAAADVYLTQPGLSPVLDLVDAARSAMGTVRLTLWASLVYNIIAAGLTMAGLITPWIAAILMPLNSLTVTIVAIRTPAFRVGRRRPEVRSVPAAGRLP